MENKILLIYTAAGNFLVEATDTPLRWGEDRWTFDGFAQLKQVMTPGGIGHAQLHDLSPIEFNLKNVIAISTADKETAEIYVRQHAAALADAKSAPEDAEMVGGTISSAEARARILANRAGFMPGGM